MEFNIATPEDAYKFSVVLFDYLNYHGQSELAQPLSEVADNCFASTADALEAHQKAFQQVKNNNPQLPDEYRHALESALQAVSEH